MSFDKSVFINCPFDDTYNAMLYSMMFTIVSLGYTPRLSLESSDAGEIRLQKIKKIISESKISIHDLSKIKAEKKGEFARMNMPFELGLDFGCRSYHEEDKLRGKKFLVIGNKPYNYMKALSDLSGIDIQYHHNKEEKLIGSIRHWFVTNESLQNIPSPKEIWKKMMEFNYEFDEFGKEKGYTKEELYKIPINEQITHMRGFVDENPYLY